MQIMVLRENVLHKNNKHSQLNYQTVHLGPVSTTAYGSEVTDGDGRVGTRTYRALKINLLNSSTYETPQTEIHTQYRNGLPIVLGLPNIEFTQYSIYLILHSPEH